VATLDYADASAFTRTFRRWSGNAPDAQRARTPERKTWRVLPLPGDEQKSGIALDLMPARKSIIHCRRATPRTGLWSGMGYNSTRFPKT